MLAATVLCYFTLYGPQPLLPYFAERYALTTARAGLIVTVAMLPLTIGPVFAGMLLSAVRPHTLMGIALVLLAGATAVFLVAPGYELILAARMMQGLMFPVILTAVTAQIAMTSTPESVARRLGFYVASTIVGGFGGRLLAGASAAIGDWRLFFAAVGVSALVLGVRSVVAGGETMAQPRSEPARRPVFRDAQRPTATQTRVFISVFLLFFVFSGTLNVLPFRTVSIARTSAPWLSGVMYAGYLMGIVTSVWSYRIVRAVGGRVPVLRLAYLLMALSIALTLVGSIPVLFGSLFAVCGSMFLIHSVSTAAVNEDAPDREGATNGLYIGSYYTGGVFGSYAAPVIYDALGWTILILLSILVVATAAALAITDAAGSRVVHYGADRGSR